MNNRVISGIIALLLTLTVAAHERTDAEMLTIAKAKLSKTLSAKRQKSVSPLTLTLKTVREDSQYRMYVAEDNSGYVIVARNEAFRPIIGYSTEPTTTSEIPCCMQACLDIINANLEARLESAETEEATGTDGTTYEVVSPLLKTYWTQRSPYNLLCPKDYTGNTSLTGCVATAMAMVMNYFQYPTSVSNKQGYYFYKTNSSGTASDTVFVDINSTYQWNKMLSTYSSSSDSDAKEAVAQLMYDCGCAAGLTYGSGSTGGSTTTAARKFNEVFGYATVNHTSKDYYSDWEWRQLIYDQLKARCPLMHSGQDPDNGGHAFVLDGIDADGLVHINWGWGKSSTGYFDILALTPTTSTKSYHFNPTGFIYNLGPKKYLDNPDEQEWQLVVGRGSSGNKNDYYKISLKEDSVTKRMRVILNTGSIFNWTPVHFKGYTGIRFESLDGGENYDVRTRTPSNGYYVVLDINSRVGRSYGGFETDHDQTPADIKPGKYKVFFSGYNSDKNNLQWRCHIRQRYKGLIYWILTVAEDGSLSLSDEIIVTSPETATPTGIKTAKTNVSKPANTNKYNLNGQRVGSDYKGIVIVNGRKVLQK